MKQYRISDVNIPGQAEEIIGRGSQDRSSLFKCCCLYRVMNSLQDSINDKSLLQLVSKTAFTPKDLKNVVSFLKTYELLKKETENRVSKFYPCLFKKL